MTSNCCQPSAPPVSLPISDADLAEARRIYRWLSFLPRFRGPLLLSRGMQALLKLSAPQADRRLRARGFRVEHRSINGAGRTGRVRIIHPPTESRGVLFDVHGGGWVLGIPAQNDAANALIAEECRVTIVSPEYRFVRPGRSPISACIDDCESAALWLLQNQGAEDLARQPVLISGDSAGAHLALCTLLRLRDGHPSVFQQVNGALLRYGLYDFSGTPSVRHADSSALILHGPTLVRGLASLTPDLDEAARKLPALSPLYADLRGLPPALLVTGEADPLRDDTLLLAERWEAAGNAAELVRVPEAPHAFDRLPTRIASHMGAHIRSWISGQLA